MGLKAALGFAVALTIAGSAVRADSLRFTAKDFLEMNETYRTGVVHGIMLSLLDFGGTSTQWGNFVRAGYNCMAAHPRTVPAYTIDFARYLEAHPALLADQIPGAFIVFIVDCPENDK